MRKNAYAKINLTLEVIGVKKNGYHLIKSVFQKIDLCDKIEIQKSNRLKINFYPSIMAEGSTVHKAVQCFQKEAGLKINARIIVEKHIPEESGLGGGSSDAASTLLLLNKMYNNPLSKEKLLLTATKIGADVPFFLQEDTALVEGTGEQITQISCLRKKFYIVLAFPNFGISTKEAYKLLDRKWFADNGGKTKMLITSMKKGEDIKNLFYNHFKIVYNDFKPEFNMFIDKINKLSKARFHITGSGSAIFSIYSKKENAKKILYVLLQNKVNAILTKTI